MTASIRPAFIVWFAAVALALSLIGTLASPVRAATFTVNTTVDAVDAVPGNGACATAAGGCSLRAAIMEANATAGPDIITVPAGVYVLSLTGAGEDAAATGDLDVTDSVTINGAGAGLTVIDGNDTDRVVHLLPGAAAVAITGLTIQNGSSGAAGLLADAESATVALDRVAVTGNTSPTVGGGIINSDFTTMTITNSTISGNVAASSGGGILTPSNGPLIITNTTISGNTAGTSGGGLWIGGTEVAGFALLNVTITNNSAATGGGVYVLSDELAVGMSVKNTIVANQASGANCAGATSALSSAGNNLSSDTSCPFTAAGDLNSTNPVLGALAANGGNTQTHALLAGSPAIDAGSNVGCPTTDQRGVMRPQDGDGNGTAVCDIGAFELVPVPPSASINDVTVTEGDAGTTVAATFTVTLSRASATQVTIAYATADGTATAPADYLSNAGALTFAPGDTSETITITVVGDNTDEPNETFVVNLSAPVNATLADAQGTGNILDDDGPPALSINDVTVTEGNAGTVNATFTVRLLPASGGTVTVAFATANGTATAPADYEPAAGTLTFTAGDTEETITVRVAGDTLDEANETFVVNLTAPSGATISDAQGTGTILDDDGAAALPDTATGGPTGSGTGLGLALVAASAALVASRRRRVSKLRSS